MKKMYLKISSTPFVRAFAVSFMCMPLASYAITDCSKANLVSKSAIEHCHFSINPNPSDGNIRLRKAGRQDHKIGLIISKRPQLPLSTPTLMQARACSTSGDDNSSSSDISPSFLYKIYLVVLFGAIAWYKRKRSAHKPPSTLMQTDWPKPSDIEARKSEAASSPRAVIEAIVPPTQPPALPQLAKASQPMRFEANTEQGFSAMDRVKAYLDAFDHDKPMPAMAYRQELKALNLDYSAESLIRLDNFLTELRVGTRPEFQQYMQRGDLQQMLTFLGMYLGTTIARVTRQSIRWMERQEVNERGTWGQLPDMFTTMISCALADTLLHLPLEVICLILFDPDQAETCVQRLNFYRKNAKPLQPFYRTSLSKVIIAQTEAEKTWAAAMRLGGVLAAYGIYLARAEALAPTTLSGSAFQTFMDTPAEIAIDQIRKNPQKLPFQSLAFDAYINLPEGRQDAVSVVIFCYGEFAVEWKIMLPYRREADGAGLVFSTPLLAFSSRSNVNLPLLSHAFYVGVNSFKTPDNTWNECLRE